MKNDDPDPLNTLLGQWQIQVNTPPDFRREIWRRISTQNSEDNWLGHLAWWLLRPRREALVLGVAVAVAIAWGLCHPPQPDVGPRDAYLMSVSPFDPSHLKSLAP